MVMVSIDLAKLVTNPENNKILKSLKNKVIAAVIVFFIPVFVNVVLSISSDAASKTFNFAACLKEAGNIKIDNSTYKPIDDPGNNKPIISDPGDYEGSKPGTTTISSTECTKGDSSVKLVPNDSNRTAKIVRKANGTDVVNYAKSWMGKLSYELTATGELKAGGKCSCSHFVYQVLNHFSIIEGGYIRSTVWGACGVKGTIIYSDYSKLVPGDVVFLDEKNAKGHVGIYAGNGKVVDCNVGVGVSTSNARNYTHFIHLNAYD